jgi:hypothetical protein
MSDTVLKKIHSMWEAEGFASPPEIEPVGGERMTLFEAYLRQVDWTDRRQVESALRVFQDTLIDVFGLWEDNPYKRQAEANVRRAIERDGLRLDDDWSVSLPIEVALDPDSLAGLADPSAIVRGLERLIGA